MLRIVIAATLGCLTQLASGQTLTADQIAQQFMPPAFAAFASTHTYLADRREWSVLPIDLGHTGRNDYLAVGYANGQVGYLRIIRLGEIPTLAGESSPAVECESQPFLEAVDLDGDGKPEVSMSCRIGNRGSQFHSFFKWTGGGVTPLNPVDEGQAPAWAPIREASLVDIDGDGVLDVLEASAEAGVDADGFVTQDYAIYRLVGDKLAKSPTGVIYFSKFLRGTGAPVTVTEHFTAPSGTFIMTIVNGTRGENMVDSAVVTLNGVKILSPASFSNRSRLIQTDVMLGARNTLSVELRSAPGSYVHVLLTPKP